MYYNGLFIDYKLYENLIIIETPRLIIQIYVRTSKCFNYFRLTCKQNPTGMTWSYVFVCLHAGEWFKVANLQVGLGLFAFDMATPLSKRGSFVGPTYIFERETSISVAIIFFVLGLAKSASLYMINLCFEPFLHYILN